MCVCVWVARIICICLWYLLKDCCTLWHNIRCHKFGLVIPAVSFYHEPKFNIIWRHSKIHLHFYRIKIGNLRSNSWWRLTQTTIKLPSRKQSDNAVILPSLIFLLYVDGCSLLRITVALSTALYAVTQHTYFMNVLHSLCAAALLMVLPLKLAQIASFNWDNKPSTREYALHITHTHQTNQRHFKSSFWWRAMKP